MREGVIIIYLSSFSLSKETVCNPNIYPYNVMANKLQLKGHEYASSNQYGIIRYFTKFIEECSYTLGENDDGRQISRLPRRSRYIKSEDILYEIKKIQQEQILGNGYIYEHIKHVGHFMRCMHL